MEQNTFLVIDGFNLLSRGYFATSYGRSEDELTRNSKGLYTNGLRVFLQKLLKLIKTHDVTHMAIAWDVKREETDRRQKYDFYKATRSELPLPLIQQYETLKQVLDRIGVKQLELAPYEADDVIGTLTARWSADSNGKCLIYSNDKDLLQLLNENTSQIISQKKEEIIFTIEMFRAEYGIDSRQWIDVKALLGDASDNIPGCPGVGDKSALSLVQQYKSLEELYEKIEELDTKFNRYKKKLITGREKAFISKELATIICDISHFDTLSFEDLRVNIKRNLLISEMDELEINIKI